MPSDRQAVFKTGATFSRDDAGELLFTFTSDGSSIIGPRPATESDVCNHEKAHAAFRAEEEAAAHGAREAIAEAERVRGLDARIAELEAVLDQVETGWAQLAAAFQGKLEEVNLQHTSALQAMLEQRNDAQAEADRERDRADRAEAAGRELEAKVRELDAARAQAAAAAKPSPKAR